jgi:hypothetical protein
MMWQIDMYVGIMTLETRSRGGLVSRTTDSVINLLACEIVRGSKCFHRPRVNDICSHVSQLFLSLLARARISVRIFQRIKTTLGFKHTSSSEYCNSEAVVETLYQYIQLVLLFKWTQNI